MDRWRDGEAVSTMDVGARLDGGTALTDVLVRASAALGRDRRMGGDVGGRCGGDSVLRLEDRGDGMILRGDVMGVLHTADDDGGAEGASGK